MESGVSTKQNKVQNITLILFFLDLCKVNTNYYKVVKMKRLKYFNFLTASAVNGKMDTEKNISAK